jgi:hypothetical protein
MSGIFAATYGVELLCTEKPTVDKARLLASLRQHCPGVRPLDGKEESGLLSFVHEDHPVQFKDRVLPAQTFMALTDARLDPAAYEAPLQQSWSFPAARDAIGKCNEHVSSDRSHVGGPVEYGERLRLFLAVLAGTLDIVRCEAVHWPRSQQLADPQTLGRALAASFSDAFFSGPLNVRLFNADCRDGEMVMDTLGLGALGLFDFQCHVRSLRPDEVARVLHNTGLYEFENGDVLADGNTVPGVDRESKWRCQREDALIQPKRAVIDLDPAPRTQPGLGPANESEAPDVRPW